MSKFISENKKTITFVVIVLIVVGIIFAYRYVTLNIGTYSPSEGPGVVEIKKYEANEYNVVTMNKEIIYRSYYKSFINLLINDPAKAYSKLTEETKERMFANNYDSYLDYLSKLNKDVLKKADISRYNDEKNKIIVIDTTESGYTFFENGVWNYTVALTGRVN